MLRCPLPLNYVGAPISTPSILVSIGVTHGLNHQSSQSRPEAALKDSVPETMSHRRQWGGGCRVTPPASSPRLVMASPLCTRHYASALRQMEPSRIQLQENKQVGSARLGRCIVSITAQTELLVQLECYLKNIFPPPFNKNTQRWGHRITSNAKSNVNAS